MLIVTLSATKFNFANFAEVFIILYPQQNLLYSYDIAVLTPR